MRECIGGPYDGDRLHDAEPLLRGLVSWMPGARDVPVRFGRYVPEKRNGEPVFVWHEEE